MGEIHGMKQMTITELAETYGRKPDTIQRKAKALLPAPSGGKWSIYSVVTEEEARIILGDIPAPVPAVSAKPTKQREPKTIPNQPAPAPEANTPGRAKFTWPSFHAVRRFIFNTLAIAVVCGHGFLIWQEAAELYGYIGSIGGAVIFAVVCLAVLIASDASRTRTSGSALWFMLFVDAAAGFVHYEALHTLSVPKAMTVGFCIFICASSFVALLLYRDSKLD